MRLTQYDLSTKGYDYIEQLDNLDPIVNKLGQLEDIEDELGIGLVTLFKALKDGIWYRLQNWELRYMKITLVLTPEGWVLAELYPEPTNVVIQLYNRMHKYGVEWGLTKEELE